MRMRLPTTSHEGARAWKSAATFNDFGTLMADWLEGKLASRGGLGRCRPDTETRPLIPVLAHCCRRGFVTTDSQPGDDTHARGSHWQQRAAVEGFVHDRHLLATLVRTANQAGLDTITNAPGGPNRGRHPVTLQDGQPVTGFGAAPRPVDLEASWAQDIGPAAYKQLTEAHHLTVIDPHWGSSTRLWDLLRAI